LNGDLTWSETAPNQWAGTTKDIRLSINIDGHKNAEFTKAPESLYYGETQNHWLLTIQASTGAVTTRFDLL
jgi:mannosyltransferase OCH1-like enzyme